MLCDKCGKEIKDDDDDFCQYCGNKITKLMKKKKTIKFLIPILGIMIISIIGIYYLFQNSLSKDEIVQKVSLVEVCSAVDKMVDDPTSTDINQYLDKVLEVEGYLTSIRDENDQEVKNEEIGFYTYILMDDVENPNISLAIISKDTMSIKDKSKVKIVGELVSMSSIYDKSTDKDSKELAQSVYLFKQQEVEELKKVDSNYTNIKEISILELTNNPDKYYGQEIILEGYIDEFIENIADCSYSLMDENQIAYILAKSDIDSELPKDKRVFKSQGILYKKENQMIYKIEKVLDVSSKRIINILTIDDIQNSIDDHSISQYLGTSVAIKGRFNFDWSASQGEILYIENDEGSLKLPFTIEEDFQRMDYMDSTVLIKGEIKIVGEQYMVSAKTIELSN